MTTRAMSVRVLPRQGGGQAATGQQRQENNALKGTRFPPHPHARPCACDVPTTASAADSTAATPEPTAPHSSPHLNGGF